MKSHFTLLMIILDTLQKHSVNVNLHGRWQKT